MDYDGYTGRLFEEEVAGCCEAEWDGVSYLSYLKSVELVKANQPFDPSDPEPQVANDLHAHIAVKLGLDDWSELRFYTAVRSPLDYHGVDAFFEFRGKIVTLDLTLNPNKEEYKADMVVHPAHLKNLELLADNIATKLRWRAV